MGRSIRRLVSLVVMLSLLSQPHAYAYNESDLAKKQNLENELEQFADAARPELDAGTQAWSKEQEVLTPKLLAAAARLDAEAKRIADTRGEDYLVDQIAKNHFIVEDIELGIKMEYRIIDGHRVPRLLIHDEVYIIVDEKIIPRDSKHLQQYISRTHHESGQNRFKKDADGKQLKTIFGNDKKISGRDLTIMFLNDDVTQVEHMVKPKATQWKWWSEYFTSKYKKPTFEDFTLAIATGVLMQGALALGTTFLKDMATGAEFSMVPTYWTMAYGLGIGTFISLYKNWTITSGSRFTRVLKSQTVSTLYALGFVMAMNDGSMGDRLSTVSIFTAEGQAKDVSILANGVMNNYAKDYWNQIPRDRESTGENAGRVAVRIPFTDIPIKNPLNSEVLTWRRASLESQVLYLIPWTINAISLITLASTDFFKVPGTSITVPILQFAGIPLAMYFAKWHARRLAERAKNDPDAQVRARELEAMALQHERVWKNSFGMDVKEIPGRISGWIKSFTAKEPCSELLSPKSETD